MYLRIVICYTIIQTNEYLNLNILYMNFNLYSNDYKLIRVNLNIKSSNYT